MMPRWMILSLACSFTIAGPLRADFEFMDFSSVEELSLVGVAASVDNKLRLTPASISQKGGAWFAVRQCVMNEFVTTFDLQITGTGGYVDPYDGLVGADGIAFVIQNESLSSLGGSGPGIGYAGIANSVAIEFDTWRNETYDDPTGNHVSVHTVGTSPNSSHHDYSLGSTSGVPELTDGSVYTIRVEYVRGTLRLFIDDLVTPVLELGLDIPGTLSLESGQAWVGFTSATGSSYESHDILNWSFSVGDDDVGLEDFADFAECITGLCLASPCEPALYTGSCCAVWDFDEDGDVDMLDFASFQELFEGGS
jgi:hypothetical protein